LQEDKIILRVVDDGKYFNPVLLDTSPDRISPENRAEGGMGISILKNLMSDIQYSRVENKNILVFEKKIA
jgi:anti-sigma regulatory factor (Ser/Thr protein kinase)